MPHLIDPRVRTRPPVALGDIETFENVTKYQTVCILGITCQCHPAVDFLEGECTNGRFSAQEEMPSMRQYGLLHDVNHKICRRAPLTEAPARSCLSRVLLKLATLHHQSAKLSATKSTGLVAAPWCTARKAQYSVELLAHKHPPEVARI